MGYQGSTIKELLDSISDEELILPSLQRNYVWREDQIVSLFDSLMRGYPVGTFLFWRVEGEDASDYSFNSFMQDVDQIDGETRGERVFAKKNRATAVLDGQQRITSIAIGLKGSYRSKVPAARKEGGEAPKRYLALNLLAKEECFEFEFRSESEITEADDSHYWYRVSRMLTDGDARDKSKISNYLRSLDGVSSNPVFQSTLVFLNAASLLQRLYEVVYDDQLSYFPIVNKDLSEAVEIFNRVNSKASRLTGADLMLSMTSADDRMDTQRKVNDAITQVKNATSGETGFVPDREFILVACLMAIESPSLSTSNKDNYSAETARRINEVWDRVIDSIANAAEYVQRLGFDCSHLSKSFLQPIVYYFYNSKSNATAASRFDSTSVEAKSDRMFITQWLLRAQIKAIFASGVSGTLLLIRKHMREALFRNGNVFPYDALLAIEGKKSIVLTMDDLEDVLSWKYGDPKVLPLLKVILNMESDCSYQVDHLWPQSKMSTKRKIEDALKGKELSEEAKDFFKSHFNLLPNLQLLKRVQNGEKNDDYFDNWIKEQYPEPDARAMVCRERAFPKDPNLWEYDKFQKFYETREEILLKKLKDCFNVV